jgi:hypothetical protein
VEEAVEHALRHTPAAATQTNVQLAAQYTGSLIHARWCDALMSDKTMGDLHTDFTVSNHSQGQSHTTYDDWERPV